MNYILSNFYIINITKKKKDMSKILFKNSDLEVQWIAKDREVLVIKSSDVACFYDMKELGECAELMDYLTEKIGSREADNIFNEIMDIMDEETEKEKWDVEDISFNAWDWKTTLTLSKTMGSKEVNDFCKLLNNVRKVNITA